MVYTIYTGGTIRGTFAERATVPTTVPINTVYIATDTGRVYIYAGSSTWNEIGYALAGGTPDQEVIVLENEAAIGAGIGRKLNFSITTDFDVTENTTADAYDVKIADNAVKTNHIENGAVTATKLAAKEGSSTQSGDGTTAAFNIAHGFGSAPSNVFIEIGSDDARGNPTITKDATNITITYALPPPSGSSNLTWYWRAS